MGPYRAALSIWRVLVASVAAGGLVVTMLEPDMVADPSFGQLLGRLVLTAAAAQTLVLWVVRQRVLESPAEAGLGGWIACWALAEGIAAMGLLAATVAASPVPALVFVVWGAALLLVNRPRPAYFQVVA
jgi:hypothetical protein